MSDHSCVQIKHASGEDSSKLGRADAVSGWHKPPLTTTPSDESRASRRCWSPRTSATLHDEPQYPAWPHLVRGAYTSLLARVNGPIL